MKRLEKITLDPFEARFEWKAFAGLLRGSATLRERTDILPFFRARNHLSLLLGRYFPNIRRPDCIAHEFVVHGDFRADLIVGDSALAKYTLVEFEDATPFSVFGKTPKTAPDWSARLEGAFSQIVDWFWKLEDMRSTSEFSHVFGRREASFQGLIVCGKDVVLGDQEKARLRWRIEKVKVDSKAVFIVTFDELLDDMDFQLREYLGV